jgi:hypothetical protein
MPQRRRRRLALAILFLLCSNNRMSDSAFIFATGSARARRSRPFDGEADGTDGMCKFRKLHRSAAS